MKLKVIHETLFCLSSVLLIMLAMAYCFDSTFPFCGSEVNKEIYSPNRKLKAVIFTRDCGATMRFSTQVSILAASAQLPNEVGNTFIGESSHVSARWIDDDNVEIDCSDNRSYEKLSSVSVFLVPFFLSTTVNVSYVCSAAK